MPNRPGDDRSLIKEETTRMITRLTRQHLYVYGVKRALTFDFNTFPFVFTVVNFLILMSPLYDPVTWYGINYAGTQNNAVRLPKQKNSYQSSPAFLCFESPTALFASPHNLFRTK